jgi:hypothetical protein
LETFTFKSMQLMFTEPAGAWMLMSPVFACIVMVSAATSMTIELLPLESMSEILLAPSVSSKISLWPVRSSMCLMLFSPSGLPGPGTLSTPFQTDPTT